jgi:hypothetical protein
MTKNSIRDRYKPISKNTKTLLYSIYKVEDRDGNTVVISRMDSNLYPVKNLEKYLLLLNRNLTKCKDRFEWRKEIRPLSYTRKIR